LNRGTKVRAYASVAVWLSVEVYDSTTHRCLSKSLQPMTSIMSFSKKVADVSEMNAVLGSKLTPGSGPELPNWEEIGCEGEPIEVMLPPT
jgi:hypothetical protein